ncbi:zinc finger CCHC domain-containing protein 24-like [Bradysia coprophila]|uniref:zinc finger CCHC domain-containing protein 24-like n=1 Tax=Bradysia coprophila TaxID=38358 RepID=UPI00187DA52D|nr:zinc finger CCHC domain-containing protein 24-like [Bradysia coprophila]
MPSQGVAFFGEFSCSKCKSKWKSTKSYENVGQTCRKCKSVVIATKQRSLKNAKKVYKAEDELDLKGIGPFFGEFNCKKCDKHWLSAWCWFEVDEMTKIPQKCKTCNVNAFAIKMRPLQKSKSLQTQPHQVGLCGKCKQLGYSCETLKLHRMADRFASWKI